VQHVEVTHRYAAPPQVVWDVYTDHARWSEWAGTPGSKLVVEGSPDRNGVGAVRAFVGGLREEILEFEPPKRMAYTVVGGFFPVRNHLGEVTLEPDGEGTRIVWRCRFEPKIPGTGALTERFVRFFFARGLRGLEKRGFSR
jgi:uncharacterized protein YndB with AHSA1/START domain